MTSTFLYMTCSDVHITVVPRGLISWSKAGLVWVLVRANTTESRSAVQVAPLEIWIAEWSWCEHAAAAASSKIIQLSFTLSLPQQSWTADHCKTLTLKFTWTPNMLGTIVFVFIQQWIHLVQNKLCMVHTKTYEDFWSTQRHCEVHRLFSGKQHAYITKLIYPLQETFTFS